MAVAWLILVAVMYFRTRPILVDSAVNSGVLRVQMILLDESLFVYGYEGLRSPQARGMLLNWKNHLFSLKLLLSLSGNIHLNPGPTDLCGICG